VALAVAVCTSLRRVGLTADGAGTPAQEVGDGDVHLGSIARHPPAAPGEAPTHDVKQHTHSSDCGKSRSNKKLYTPPLFSSHSAAMAIDRAAGLWWVA
jgi:hypothetical protein